MSEDKNKRIINTIKYFKSKFNNNKQWTKYCIKIKIMKVISNKRIEKENKAKQKQQQHNRQNRNSSKNYFFNNHRSILPSFASFSSSSIKALYLRSKQSLRMGTKIRMMVALMIRPTATAASLTFTSPLMATKHQMTKHGMLREKMARIQRGSLWF